MHHRDGFGVPLPQDPTSTTSATTEHNADGLTPLTKAQPGLPPLAPAQERCLHCEEGGGAAGSGCGGGGGGGSAMGTKRGGGSRNARTACGVVFALAAFVSLLLALHVSYYSGPAAWDELASVAQLWGNATQPRQMIQDHPSAAAAAAPSSVPATTVPLHESKRAAEATLASLAPLPPWGWDRPNLSCMTPSLRRDDFHIVMGTVNASTCYHWLVPDMGLTNTHVLVYRRADERQPLASYSLPCGVAAEERLLLPNRGLDANVFYSYILEFYDKLPKIGVAVLHGHGEHYHVRCEALFARLRLWYHHAASGGPMAGRVVTLVSTPYAAENVSDWCGGDKCAWGTRRSLRGALWQTIKGTLAARTPPLAPPPAPPGTYTPGAVHPYAKNVSAVFRKWKVDAPVFGVTWGNVNETKPPPRKGGFQSCCSNLIIPSERIKKYPRGFYQDMQQLVQNLPQDFHSARIAYEYVLYPLFHAKALDQEALDFYHGAQHFYADLSAHPALRRCRRGFDVQCDKR